MQRLRQVAHQMGEHEQSFLFVLDVERAGRWSVEEDGNRGIHRGNQIVVVRAGVIPVEVISLNGYVIEVICVVAAQIRGGTCSFRVDAVDPVPAGVIDHRSAIVRERRAGRLVSGIDDVRQTARRSVGARSSRTSHGPASLRSTPSS